MMATIHQPQYLPWLGYFDKAHRADIFILLDNVQFKKNEWQNRNKIRTPQGWQWITVPVLHDFGQKIKEVRINNKEPWRKSHLKALQLNYSKAPFFNDYIGFFEKVYGRDWEYLADINTYLIEKFIEFLGIKTKIIKASQYEVTEDSTQRLVELCQKVGVDQYLSGRDGSKYMDFGKFEENNIKVVVQDFHHPVYHQLWGNRDGSEFLSHLSVADLLFNHGKDSLHVLSGKGIGV